MVMKRYPNGVDGKFFFHHRHRAKPCRGTRRPVESDPGATAVRPEEVAGGQPATRLNGVDLEPPIEPMEAETQRRIPLGESWHYEPKWDGFRCVIFKNKHSAYLQSRDLKPLGRYFPEIEEFVRNIPVSQFVLDGEFVIPPGRRLEFELLQLRLHPAASRVRKLAVSTSATFVAFDLLADQGSRIRLSPVTRDPASALRWLVQTGHFLDGVVAKRLLIPYRPGERCMVKVKNYRTADCVVGGFRVNADGTEVTSLLPGFFDASGQLNQVGFLGSLKEEIQGDLTRDLLRLQESDP